MAVAPALTYPSKTIRFATQPNLALLFLVRRRSTPPNMIATLTRATPLTPILMFRSEVGVVANVDETSVRARGLLVVKRRKQQMVVDVARIQTFPIPYLSRITTRPPYGPQWPRFAVYGSTM